MENNERKAKEAEIQRIKLHFKYTASILLGISVLVIAFVFYDKKVASDYLTYSGTALSIVLSVIAILITLIDVAGQKKQVYEIYNTSEELKSLIENHQIATNSMKELMESYNKSFELYQKNIENVDTVIRELINGQSNEFNNIRVSEDEKDIVTNDNGVTNMNALSSVLGGSEIINSNFSTQKYKTFKISKSLNREQEKEVNEILDNFRTIKVKFYNDKIELYHQPLKISPFVDFKYDKDRASILIKRFLEKEGLI